MRNINFSRATAPAKVTTASCTPRIRSAGIPIITPHRTATKLANSVETGNGIPALVANFDKAKPAVPATEACASEICPINPVKTTNDNMIMLTMRLVIKPNRYPPLNSDIAINPSANRVQITHGLLRGRTTSGSGSDCTAPREGSDFPTANSATVITKKGTASVIPVTAQLGHHDLLV